MSVRRVLVVEDDKGIADLLKLALLVKGATEVVILDTAAAALAAEGDFEAVVTDKGLRDGPEMGLDVVRHFVGRGIPVAMISGGGEAAQAEAMEAGASLFFGKPFGCLETCEAIMAMSLKKTVVTGS